MKKWLTFEPQRSSSAPFAALRQPSFSHKDKATFLFGCGWKPRYAIMAYFGAELGGEEVKKLVQKAVNHEATLYLSIINLGEVYYLIHKRLGKAKAQSIVTDIQSLPVTISSVTEMLKFGRRQS